MCRFQAAEQRRLFNNGLSNRRNQRRRVDMAQVKVFYDEVGNTLTVWFGNPEDEHVAEETGDEVVLMKDKTGRVIGFEKLNFSIAKDRKSTRLNSSHTVISYAVFCLKKKKKKK